MTLEERAYDMAKAFCGGWGQAFGEAAMNYFLKHLKEVQDECMRKLAND